MTTFDFDLVTIGGGSGGVAASRRAATHGARVALCEQDRVGGTCVVRGCVPKKLMAYAAEFQDALEDSSGFGWNLAGTFEWARLQRAIAAEVERLERLYQSMLRDAGVTLVRGRACVVDAHTIEVEGSRITARHILLAPGASPRRPDVPGAHEMQTSDDVFGWSSLPRRVVIVGGGYIAVELGCIFSALGSSTTLVTRGGLLGSFDLDVRQHVVEELTARGLQLRLHEPLLSVKRTPGGLQISTTAGVLGAEAVVAATGRTPSTCGLVLREVGVRLDALGAIVVDAQGRTSVPSIHAVGDATPGLHLTPVAIAQGRALADYLFSGQARRVDTDLVPTAVFCHPQVAAVGLTEQQAREGGLAVEVYLTRFRPLKHTLSKRTERTLMKLVVETGTQRVLGCHLVGRDAAEIIQGVAIALQCGARKPDFDRTIGVHPSAAEELVTLRTPVSL